MTKLTNKNTCVCVYSALHFLGNLMVNFDCIFNLLFCSCRCLVLWPSRQLHFKTSSFKDTASPSAVYWVPECKVPWWFGGGPANPVMSGKESNIDILMKNFMALE